MSKNYMRFTLAVACLVQSIAATVQAQNLVPNPGFEVQDTCPAVSEIELAQPWNSPTLGTPDLFNTTCGSQNGSPHTGYGSAGFYTYSTFPDNREYVQVQLLSPLVAGEMYQVSFYVKRLTFYSYAVNRIGAYFSSSELNLSTTSSLSSLNPQVEHTSMLNGTAYTLISGTFTASGGEEYLIIGNFRDDAGTTIEDVETNGNNKSYYYIDDVSVTEVTSAGINAADENVALKVFPNPSSGEVYLTLEGIESSSVSFSIYNAAGSLVMHDVYGTNSQRILDLSSLEKGVYMVQLYSNEQFIGNQRVLLH